MKRWIVLLGLAALGAALLTYTVPRTHLAARWRIRSDRELSQERARELSAAMGVDTSGWMATVTGATDKDGAYFAEQHPGVPEARRYSPVYPNVALASPRGSEVVVAALSASGEPRSWELKGFSKSKSLDLDAARKLSAAALARFMGPEAASFGSVPAPSESEGTLTIAFERSQPMAERFEATVNGSRLVKAELRPLHRHEVDDALSARQKAVEILTGVAVVAIYFLGSLFAVGVYVFWAARHAVRHRFILAFSVPVLLWGAVYWWNWFAADQRFDSLTKNESFMENFLGAAAILLLWAALYVVVIGASDAVALPSKLGTLRSIFGPAAFNRRAGSSILSGMLCAPLAAALPLALSSLRLFGSQQTGPLEQSRIFAAHSALQAFDVLPSLALIGLFGFGAPQLDRLLPKKKWISLGLLSVVGVLLLAPGALPKESSPAVFLANGALLLVVYWQLFARVDLLATLAAAWSASVLWNGCELLLQPSPSLHASGIATLAMLAGCAGCAALIAWRGRAAALDDAVAPAVLTSQRETLMKEFSIAHRVQQEMLPARPPEIPGCTVAASCQPAQEVGGDLFEFLRLPDGRWTIGVGDVSGKGVPAALYMTLTKGLLMATTQDSSDLVDIIGHVNRHIHAATERKTFVTMALGAFDPETRTLDHVRAGHNPVVWRRASDGAVSLLNSPGLGLGIVSDRLFRRSIQLARVQLGAGDTLVFYSDGLTEAMNAEREQFGEERLMRTVSEVDGLDAGGIRERIVGSVKQFLGGIPPQDDMTIVVLRVN